MAGATDVPAPVAAAEPTLLSRLNRLDVMMGYLEEIWAGRSRGCSEKSGSPCDVGSGGEASPRSVDKGCQPLREAVVETKTKGSLVDRLKQLEEQILQLSIHLEEEMEHEKKEKEAEFSAPRRLKKHHPNPKKGFKKLVKSCMIGKAESQ